MVPGAGRGGAFGAFASLVVALRYPIILGWIAAAVLAVLYLPTLADDAVADHEGLVADDSEAVATEVRAAGLFAVPLPARSLVVQRDPSGLSEEQQTAAVERAIAANEGRIEGLDGVLLAFPITNTGRLVPGSREDGTTAITYLFFAPEAGIVDQTHLAREYAAAIPPDEAPVGVTGATPARLDQFVAIAEALPFVQVGTLALVALIFGVAFRSLGAPLVVLAAAGLAYLTSIRLVAWLGVQLETVTPREVEPLALALLLGLVTDYAAFYLTGTRSLLAEGEGRVAAARTASLRYTPIVTTAGLIVSLGTATLVLARLEFFRAFAPALSLTVLVTLVVGITFIPAALAVFGRLVYWPRAPKEDPEEAEPPRWRRALVRFATLRPIALLVVLALSIGLLALATPLRGMQLGFGLVEAHGPRAEVRQASEAAGRGFVPGIVSPTVLVLEGRGVGEQEEELRRLSDELVRQPGVAAALGPGDAPFELPPGVFVSEDGDAARLVLVLAHEPLGADAIETLSEIRDGLPDLLDAVGLDVQYAGFGGDTALAEETVELLLGDFRRVAVAAILVNLLLLAAFLRAVVAPVYLLLASALSLAASLGVTTYVFQEVLGHGDLTYYVPFAVAVLSLSLGSDYNLFVTGRIWQEAGRRRLRDAIRFAAPRSARAIAIAGLTLAGSFAVLAVIPLRSFREFAFAMAAGVLLDTFVVRPLLVPSLVSLFGRLGFWPRPGGVDAREAERV
jgi:putative drug exporter of the RND superfamily